MSVGRNDPCPCGSGKKSKHCCQGQGTGAFQGALPGSDAQRLSGVRRAARALFAAERFGEAVAPFRELVRLQPKSAEAHYDLAVVYFRLGQFPAAAEGLREVLKLRPSYPQALSLLAQTLEYLGPPSEAAAVHRRLSRAAADPRQKLHHTARAEVLEGKLADAEASLRRMLTLAPNDGRARALLGQILLDQRRFDDAAVELRLALETAPTAFKTLSQAQRFTPADRDLLLRMEAQAKAPGVPAEDRALILYGLGKAYDDLGEPAPAIAAYDAANALRRQAARYDRVALDRRYDALIGRYGSGVFATLGSGSASPDPRSELPLFIVGLPRSGTTLVEQILSSHPRVVAGGELQFWRMREALFDIRLQAWRDPAALREAAKDYLGLLGEIGPGAARVTDKAPLNFEALGLILSALPQARVIHCRRTPIDTALSIYFTEFASSLGFAFDRGDIVHAWCAYRRLMSHWRAVLPLGRMLEVDYESLVADPEPQIRRLVAFAGLPWDDACLAPENNPRVVKTASLWQVRQPIYRTSVERWRRYEPWLGELAALVVDSA